MSDLAARLREAARNNLSIGRSNTSLLFAEAAAALESQERATPSANASMDADTADAARVFPIARPVREWFGHILDAENRQIAKAPNEYGVQIVHALNAAAAPAAAEQRAGTAAPAAKRGA